MRVRIGIEITGGWNLPPMQFTEVSEPLWELARGGPHARHEHIVLADVPDRAALVAGILAGHPRNA